MMKTEILVFGLLIASFVNVHCQLVLPEQICEMECLRNISAPSYLTYEDPRAQRCRDYCLVHAYDFLKEFTTEETTKSKEVQ